MRLGLSEPLRLPGVDGQMKYEGQRPAIGPHQLAETRPAELDVPLSVATDPADLVSATALLAGDLLAEFGLPQPPAFRVDGTLDVEELSAPRDGPLLAWGRRTGVLVPCP